MLKLYPSKRNELELFTEMEKSTDVSEFIFSNNLDEHIEQFVHENIIYLTIVHDSEISGFFILHLDSDMLSVEFRRIVVSKRGNGIGQMAITEMETYCSSTLKRKRLWLDVLETNSRGQHIYEKLNFKRFKTSEHSNQTLHFYEKAL